MRESAVDLLPLAKEPSVLTSVASMVVAALWAAAFLPLVLRPEMLSLAFNSSTST